MKNDTEHLKAQAEAIFYLSQKAAKRETQNLRFAIVVYLLSMLAIVITFVF